MAGVRFEGVWKVFGSTPVVSNLSLDVEEGEFLVFVGPSGCGKTTSLRMLAGLDRPTYGRIWLGDRVVNNDPPGERDISMVFQSYALYPHMTVRRNLAFGPGVRREPRAQTRQRIEEVAETLGITSLLDRRPSELSGGQRQRVALGRALIRRPQLFLMDEPLSNLDAALRVQMRAELIRLHQLFEITTVYVTHDQVEAMTMGERIAVMNDGVLQQVDSPEALYENPAHLFVATFIGSPKMNTFSGTCTSHDASPTVRCLGTTFPLAPETPLRGDAPTDGPVIVGVRPVDVRWAREAPADCSVVIPARIDIVEPMGSETYVTVKAGDTTLMARFPGRSGVRSGETVEVAIDPKNVYLFDPKSNAALLDRSGLVAPSSTWTAPAEQHSLYGSSA
ncbi:MAG TPA: ABC transporter ATP-binding protein [Chloroflexota bacterium]